MNKTVFKRVPATLTGEDGKKYQVELDLTIREIRADDGTVLERIIDRRKLAPRSGYKVPDVDYTLTFMFDDVQQEGKVRKSGRTLLHRQ